MKKILVLLLVFVMTFVVTISVSAETPPALPDELLPGSSYYGYVVYDGNYKYYLTNSSLWATSTELSATVRSSEAISFKYYLYTNGEWVRQGSYNDIPKLNLGNILYNSVDVYTSDGVLALSATPDFFYPPRPLAEVIQEVTGKTLQEEAVPAVGGTMTILALCGVGLIASLVVLKLFGKRSLIYHS